MKLEFSRQIFPKNTEMWSFVKIRQVGDELILSVTHDEADNRLSQISRTPPLPPPKKNKDGKSIRTKEV